MNMATRALLYRVREMIPPMLETMHKGQQGRVAIMGGSEDYTGAPFFAGNAAALLGADMVHIVCEPQAAQVIKTYSPNLMVHPLMRQTTHAAPDAKASDFSPAIASFLDRVHSLVVGPGLGRDPLMQALAADAIAAARSKGLGIVIDADALMIVMQKPVIVEGYRNAVLTPNVVEFARLSKALGVGLEEGEGGENCRRLAERLGGVTVVQKGVVDWISNGSWTKKCAIRGGLKRSGGQGDTLSGSLGTMLAWRHAYLNDVWEHEDRLEIDHLVMLAAFGASAITRLCSKRAYEKRGRSMQAADLPLEIHGVFEDLFVNEAPSEEALLHH